jgi:putative iron-dependent peroxidase
MGFGTEAWDRLFGNPRPAELRPFAEISGVHHAPSTPGDILFHIRATHMDLCFELASQVMSRIGNVVTVADEVHGFKYFDERDLLGFVDGTEQQEKIIGRKKLSDIELDDDAKPSYAHNVLTVIEEDGEQLEIVRDNMPFGEVGKGEFGTYFIGYARSPSRVERMLANMFIGRPPGNYDRILDFSKAVTGTLFFVPSATFLEGVD